MQRKNFLFDDETLECLERLKARYGIGNQTDVIRFAVRVLDVSPTVMIPIPEPLPQGRPAHRAVKTQKS